MPRAANKQTDLTNPANCERFKELGGDETTCSKSVNQWADQDAWAYAIELCGGTNNMPTNEELKKLANYIYKVGDNFYTTPLERGWTGVNQTHNVAGFTLDMNAMEKYNLKSAWNGSHIEMWSGSKITGSDYAAWYIDIYSNGLYYGSGNRRVTIRYAMCLGEPRPEPETP